MNLDDLRILNAVAQSGSMSRAATKLHMVQSNVTARVRQMEEELGVPLFVRHSRGVTLNEAGQRLLSYSGRLDALFQEAIAAVKEDGNPKGSLRLGSLEQTLSARLPRVLEQYTTRYPAVALTLTTGNSADLIAQVFDQSLDGAFVRGPVTQPGLISEPIFWEELVLVTGPATQSLGELQQSEVKAFVLAQGCTYREVLSNVLDRNSISHQLMAVGSYDAIRSLVEANVGVTLMPKEYLAASWKDAVVTAHELPSSSTLVETAFISRNDQPRSSALEAFLALSRKASNVPSKRH